MGRNNGFSGSSQVADIGGSVVCTGAGTTEKNITDAASEAGVSIELQTTSFDTVTNNYLSAVTSSQLAVQVLLAKAKQQPDGENWVIFQRHLSRKSAQHMAKMTQPSLTLLTGLYMRPSLPTRRA